ncbi:hypothetical protein HFN88_05245 [Rhizobium laguerreae]|nr:hypothetical protein [Rhizobium laguerreae]MBY3392091.1 hypothetical protein [Rhizobium laguerreae]MBY5665750.1 hypothetical protein [Rhizobium leguminosarum]MBY5679458.1 hypothetical protein [Rhizobium leguminosarum]
MGVRAGRGSGFQKKGSADRADGEGHHAVPADEKTDRQEKFGIAAAEDADSRGEGQGAAPIPVEQKSAAPVSNREHHLWATVLDVRVPMMPKRYPARLENQGNKGFS